MNKEVYETPRIEVEEYTGVDVLTASPGGGLEYGNTDTNVP